MGDAEVNVTLRGPFRLLRVRGSGTTSIVVSPELHTLGMEVLLFLLSVLLVGKVIAVAGAMLLML